jgi:pimeloyl-ACP methyl ester carboxylesterase
MSERAVVLGGVRTRVVDEGVGPAVVLVHATPFDLDYWSGLALVLKRARRVIRYDLPGHGAATDAPVPATAQLVADLAELLDRLEVADAHVVGHSLGAVVAQRFALDHPARTRRLSLLAARASPSPLFATLADAMRCDAAIADISTTRWFTPEQLARNGSAVQYARTRIQHTPVHAWADGLARVAAADDLAELPRLVMPAEVVVGEDDHGAVPEHGRAIADAIPTASFHLVPRARSLLSLQYPEVVAPLLR